MSDDLNISGREYLMRGSVAKWNVIKRYFATLIQLWQGRLMCQLHYSLKPLAPTVAGAKSSRLVGSRHWKKWDPGQRTWQPMTEAKVRNEASGQVELTDLRASLQRRQTAAGLASLLIAPKSRQYNSINASIKYTPGWVAQQICICGAPTRTTNRQKAGQQQKQECQRIQGYSTHTHTHTQHIQLVCVVIMLMTWQLFLSFVPFWGSLPTPRTPSFF